MNKGNKKDIFVFGYMKQPKYCVDFHRSKVCHMLSKNFRFYSLDDGFFPKHVNIFHSKPWAISQYFYRGFKLRNRKMKHICTFYGLPMNKKIGKKYIKIADVITTVSFTTMREALHTFGDADYRVIYDAVNTELYKPIKNKKNESIRVLMVITSARNLKNHRVFIQMAKSFPEVDFILRTFSNVNKSILPPNVIIDNTKYPSSNKFGESEGLRDLYNSADIYLFPSIHEGLNNTMLEAMACGLPVISFDISSMPELIDHDKNGFLCSSFREMEKYLLYLINDEKARVEMGKKSRKISEWFTWEKCAKGFRELYEELMN